MLKGINDPINLKKLMQKGLGQILAFIQRNYVGMEYQHAVIQSDSVFRKAFFSQYGKSLTEKNAEISRG